MLPFTRMVEYGNTVAPTAPIKKIQTYLNSVYVLMSSGQLYVRGFNSSGQLGIGSTTTVTTWTLSTTLVDDMWVGGSAALIRKMDGTYQFTGNNTNGSTTFTLDEPRF